MEIINKDLFRYAGNTSFKSFLKCYFVVPGFKYMYWFRKASYWRKKIQDNKLYYPIFVFFELGMRHYGHLYGIDIQSGTKIGEGFYIGHFSGIVISTKAIIGRNVNISQCITIGSNDDSFAIIEDGVYIAPGAKIIGGVHIGSFAAIGANAVVVKDVAPYTTVGGIPAKVISNNSSERYIKNRV